MTVPIDFGLLGPLEVRAGDRRLPLGGERQRRILAGLLLSAGEMVPTSDLVTIVWDEDPPETARRQVHSGVWQLRRTLSRHGAAHLVHTEPAGYRLRSDPDRVDLARFMRAVSAGRRRAALGDLPGAAHELREAVSLWRGPALAGVTGGVLEREAAALEQLRLAALEDCLDCELACGGASDAVAELAALAAEHPLRERFAAMLMVGLYRCGRQAEALDVYRRAASILAEELGIDPGPELRRCYEAILRRDPSLDGPAAMTDAARPIGAQVASTPAAQLPPPTLPAGHGGDLAAAVTEAVPDQPAAGVGHRPEDRVVRLVAIPRQLPADVSGFTGRDREIAALDSLLAPDADGTATATVISLISGMAGVGKTALAIHCAHRARGRFPDGQLYVNLRGYDPDQPMTAADALVGFLTALGVVGQDIPLEVEDRAARYRTQVADRRMLIVLDNVSTVEQVRLLLPGTGSCAVLVTSRDSLAGLVAVHGAHRLDLDLLPAADACALLRRLIGPRADTEPDATATLADRCARLPLALRVAAELAVARPGTPLSDLVTELADQQRRLDLLDAGGDPRAAVAAVFSWSLRHLPAHAARTFALLGLHPGPDLDAHAAAALADTSLQQARRTLDRLTHAHLVHPTSRGRYGMHDLLRAYATSLATTEDSTDAPRATLGRLFDYYLATTATAMDRLYPAEAHRRPRIPPSATPTPDLPDPDTARAWLDTERSCLVAVTAYTATHGWHPHAVQLSTTLYRYLTGGHHTDAIAIHDHGRRAARHAGDPAGEAEALLGLGTAHGQMGQYGHAAEYFEQALILLRRTGDQMGEARALGNLGIVVERQGGYEPAAEYFVQGLALFRQAGDQVGEARMLTTLGFVAERLGRYGPAADHHRQALALFRQLGDRAGEAITLNNLGIVEVRLGQHRSALDHHQQALTLFQHVGHRSGQAWALDHLGTVHTRLGRPEQAAEHHLQALALFREIGDRDGEAWAQNGLGEAAHTTGHHTDALTHHTDALAIAQDTGNRDEQARAHTGLGHTHRALGSSTRAREHYDHAVTLYTDLGMPDAADIRASLATLNHAARNGHNDS